MVIGAFKRMLGYTHLFPNSFIGNSKGAILDQENHVRILTSLKKKESSMRDVLKNYFYGGQQIILGSFKPDNRTFIFLCRKGEEVGHDRLSLVLESYKRRLVMSRIYGGITVVGLAAATYFGYAILMLKYEKEEKYEMLLLQDTDVKGKMEVLEKNLTIVDGKVNNLASRTDATHTEVSATYNDVTAVRDDVSALGTWRR